MASPIEYQKVMSEIVYINLPAPQEPKGGMSGPEVLHGFLGEFFYAKNQEVQAFFKDACLKWNVHYRQQEDN